MLIVSIIVFFRLNIVQVICNLTGISARKAIEEINRRNADASPKKNSRVEIATKIESKAIKTTPLGKKTTSKTTPLQRKPVYEPTTLAASNSGGTQLLNPSASYAMPEPAVCGAVADEVFQVEYQITYIHTDEVISTGPAM